MARAAVVMVCTGRSTRPATTQPKATEARVMMARVIPDRASRWFRSAAYWLAAGAGRWERPLRLKTWSALVQPESPMMGWQGGVSGEEKRPVVRARTLVMASMAAPETKNKPAY